jgi:TonB family protein
VSRWPDACHLVLVMPDSRKQVINTLRFMWLWLMILAMPAIAAAAATLPVAHLRMMTSEESEHQLWKTRVRDSQFSDVPHVTARSRCEDVQPPQALTTPEPILNPMHDHMKAKVSFIIGTDGRVHSPLILESAGPTGDRHILRTVRSWRYRPATCNGVPTETEGKVEFSSR